MMDRVLWRVVILAIGLVSGIGCDTGYVWQCDGPLNPDNCQACIGTEVDGECSITAFCEASYGCYCMSGGKEAECPIDLEGP